MCGICGKVNLSGDGQDHQAAVRAMSDRMIHRGPDGAGVYSDPFATIGHRRLSIIDLAGGGQPISNEDDTVWIVFNGEIYNHAELRKSLSAKGHRFKTATDTEVIVHLYEEYNDACLAHLDGMFAFAIWDCKMRKLLLARDRLGIKPVYYTQTRDQLMFASELKALLVDPDCPRNTNSAVISRFLTLGYSAGNETPFADVYKLDPGYYITAVAGTVSFHQYWDLEFPETPRKVSFDQARGELIDLLDKTIGAHMMSDVPVGVLLSGGVDSSGVLSYAANHTTKQVRAFTLGFDSKQAVDERPYARLAARHFGASHHEVTIGPEEFRDFLPKYVWYMEELVCEPPAIALYFITKLAHEHGVKVVLSGEGGDEAFAGYNTYRNQLRVEQIRELGEPWLRMAGLLAGMAGRVTGKQRMARAAHDLGLPLEQRYVSRTADSNNYFVTNPADIYSEESRGTSSADSLNGITALFANVQNATPLSRMLYIDTKTWLPDDLLVKADKMTMANSVELRVPLLDHHVLEFAASLPDSYKVQGQKTKYLLKEALRGRVPGKILNRPKAGFPVPFANWLRYELWDFVCEHLGRSQSHVSKYVKYSAIQRILGEHRAAGSRGREVFSLLVLELWHQQFVETNGFSTSMAVHRQ